MKWSGEDLTSLPSSQLKATPAVTAALSFFGAPLLAVLFSWLVDKTGGGEELKQQVIFYLLGTGGIGTVTGVVGMVQRGLKLTDAKIKNQTPRDLPETINAGGDVNVGDTPENAGTAASERYFQPMSEAGPQVLAEPLSVADSSFNRDFEGNLFPSALSFVDPVAPGVALPSE